MSNVIKKMVAMVIMNCDIIKIAALFYVEANTLTNRSPNNNIKDTGPDRMLKLSACNGN
jgi:hypothetical protein